MDRELEFDGFQWDEGNRGKCGAHGVSLAEIESLFRGVPGVYDDPDHSEQEPRLRAIEQTHVGRYVFVGRGRQDPHPPHQRPLHARERDTAL